MLNHLIYRVHPAWRRKGRRRMTADGLYFSFYENWKFTLKHSIPEWMLHLYLEWFLSISFPYFNMTLLKILVWSTNGYSFRMCFRTSGYLSYIKTHVFEWNIFDLEAWYFHSFSHLIITEQDHVQPFIVGTAPLMKCGFCFHVYPCDSAKMSLTLTAWWLDLNDS